MADNPQRPPAGLVRPTCPGFNTRLNQEQSDPYPTSACQASLNKTTHSILMRHFSDFTITARINLHPIVSWPVYFADIPSSLWGYQTQIEASSSKAMGAVF
jgi:hypothetical protein